MRGKCKVLPIGAGKKAKHTMVDKVVNTTLPPRCSLNPAASSTLIRPAESAASQSRCAIADLRHVGQVRSWTKVLPLRSVLVPVAVTCQQDLFSHVQAQPGTHRWLAARSRCAGRPAFCECQLIRRPHEIEGNEDLRDGLTVHHDLDLPHRTITQTRHGQRPNVDRTSP